MDNQPLTSQDILNLFSSMPTGQLVFLGLFFGTWIIGGNILVALHYKRLGKHWMSGFKPFAFPFKSFNSKEWLALAVLVIVALMFGRAGIMYGN